MTSLKSGLVAQEVGTFATSGHIIANDSTVSVFTSGATLTSYIIGQTLIADAKYRPSQPIMQAIVCLLNGVYTGTIGILGTDGKVSIMDGTGSVISATNLYCAFCFTYPRKNA